MIHQLQSYLTNYEGGYSHRSAIRYLYKRELQLWADILSATSFLPTDAKAKQRCWHILNNTYTRPTCPTTNEFTKWFENRYLTYISQRAKALDPNIQAKVCKPWKNDESRKSRVRNTFAENRAEGKHTIVDSPFSDAKVQAKCKATMLDRYGYENNFHSTEKQNDYREWMNDDTKVSNALEKAKQTRIERGLQIPDEDKSAQEMYLVEVQKVTERNYKEFKHLINPNDLHRTTGKYHLDHIFSKHQGFIDGVSPEVIGHYTNLQMLWHSDNESKCARSDLTLTQLLAKQSQKFVL